MDCSEAVLRGVFRALNTCMRKERSKINKLRFYLRKLGKEQTQPKVRTGKERIKEQKSTKQEINREKATKPKAVSLKRSIKLINF